MNNQVKRRYTRMRAYTPQMPLLMAIIGSCMLGMAPIFVRMTDIGANATGCYRLLFSLPFLWIWIKLEDRANPHDLRHTPRGREWLYMLLGGFFFALDLATWHISIDMTSIVNASIFNNLTPVFVPIVAWIIYSKRPTGMYLVSAIIALLGCVILTGSTFTLDADNWAGDSLAIFSAVCYSGYILVVKSLRTKFNAPTIMFWTSFSNVVFLAIFGLYMGEDFILNTWKDWVGVLGLAIAVHIFGQGLLAYSMGKLSAGFVSVTMLLGPVVASFMGWIFFGEALLWMQALGGMIVLSSIITAHADDKAQQAKSAGQ